MANKLEVGPAEAGQSLLRFLQRRLGCPKADIYRWLRSGEVRVNGGRAKAGHVLAAGDLLRVPPQAGAGGASLAACAVSPEALGQDLHIVFQDDEILALNKPYGLPVHGGTRHVDSLAARLKAACGAGDYIPAPAHRLDLHATGLILAGKTHAAQSWLHGLFREGKSDLQREYLCWARGDASRLLGEPRLCVDFLAEERDLKGRERMAVAAEGKEAQAWYHCLEVRRHPEFGLVSLVSARLLTGRKHQIRAQLAARRLPLLGDWRYGGTRKSSMLLHAIRIALPDYEPPMLTVDPPWSGFFAIGESNA